MPYVTKIFKLTALVYVEDNHSSKEVIENAIEIAVENLPGFWGVHVKEEENKVVDKENDNG